MLNSDLPINDHVGFKGVHRILVIKLRHIGDVLLTAPVFRTLRSKFPDAHIAALVNSGTEDVLTGNPFIDEIIVFDRSIKKMPFFQKVRREIQFLKEVANKNFDMVYDLTPNDRGCIIAYATRAKYRISFMSRKGLYGRKFLFTHLVKKDSSGHMVTQNLSILQGVGIKGSDINIDFYIPAEAVKFAENIFKREGITERDTVIIIHPLSRWFFKCWKDEHMAEVINWLIIRGTKVIVTSGPEKKEMMRIEKILSIVDNPVVNISGQTDIKQLAAIIKFSNLFIGVDSAPMHLASALKVPAVALFGPTNEKRWGPWNTKSIVLSEAAQCKSCKMTECNGSDYRKCMERISPEKVKIAIETLLCLQKKNASLTCGIGNTITH